MSKVEVIYLKPKEEEIVYIGDNTTNYYSKYPSYVNRTNKSKNLKTQTKVHCSKTTDNKEKKNNKQELLKKINNLPKKSNFKRAFSALVVLALLMTSVGIVALNFGYIPVKALTEINEEEKPVGYSGEVSIETYVDKYTEMKNMPNLDDVNYKIFLSDATKDTVANNYIYDREKEGYNLEYQGSMTKKGITFSYYGFIKGLTGVGVIITDVDELGVNIDRISGGNINSIVLYTKGSVHYYREIISWCKNRIKNLDKDNFTI